MKIKKIKDVYLSAVEKSFGRILSCLDTELISPTYGSFDRTWWNWKFTDYSAPRMQEGAFFLAWLGTSELSPFNKDAKIRFVNLSLASIKFWQTLQRKNGCFDEAYPYEHSLAATAFTTFYIGESLIRIKKYISEADKKSILNSLEKSAKWLAKNGEYHGILSNHLAAAAASLHVVGNLLDSSSLLYHRDVYLKHIFDHQSKGRLANGV